MSIPASSGRGGQGRRNRHRSTSRHGATHYQRAGDQNRKWKPRPGPTRTVSNSAAQRRKPKNKRAGTSIDPRRFVHKALAPKAETAFVSRHEFADFGLHPTIKKNLENRHYKTPTPIQDVAIPHILKGRDVIGLANTGTGKTAAFVLPLIHRLINSKTQERVLITAPTRELAQQIDADFRAFAKDTGLRSAICVGGTSMQIQRNALRPSPQFIIGTPGRLIDLIGQKLLKLGETRTLVLDEFDRMLDMGFIKDIERILSHLPKHRQSLCFSATVTPEIQHILERILIDPVTLSVVKSETNRDTEQEILRVHSKNQKLEQLRALLVQSNFKKVLVFGRTKWGVQKLARKLTQAGIAADAIHGNKTQPQRQRALNAFKSGLVDVLVATDVAARGLDIPDVSHVINFDEPATYDDYIHRIGRTGRAGKPGHAITFIETPPRKQPPLKG